MSTSQNVTESSPKLTKIDLDVGTRKGIDFKVTLKGVEVPADTTAAIAMYGEKVAYDCIMRALRIRLQEQSGARAAVEERLAEMLKANPTIKSEQQITAAQRTELEAIARDRVDSYDPDQVRPRGGRKPQTLELSEADAKDPQKIMAALQALKGITIKIG